MLLADFLELGFIKLMPESQVTSAVGHMRHLDICVGFYTYKPDSAIQNPTTHKMVRRFNLFFIEEVTIIVASEWCNDTIDLKARLVMVRERPWFCLKMNKLDVHEVTITSESKHKLQKVVVVRQITQFTWLF